MYNICQTSELLSFEVIHIIQANYVVVIELTFFSCRFVFSLGRDEHEEMNTSNVLLAEVRELWLTAELVLQLFKRTAVR